MTPYPILNRLERHVLGLISDTPPVSDAEVEVIHTVELCSLARAALKRYLGAGGRVRSGVLFGYALEGILHVTHAAPATVGVWDAGSVGSGALDLNPAYLLGWTDALRLSEGAALPRLDWVGQWLAYPHNQQGDVEDDLAWLLYGAQWGYFDDRHPLLSVGYRDGVLSAQAYLYDHATRTPIAIITQGQVSL